MTTSRVTSLKTRLPRCRAHDERVDRDPGVTRVSRSSGRRAHHLLEESPDGAHRFIDVGHGDGGTEAGGDVAGGTNLCAKGVIGTLSSHQARIVSSAVPSESTAAKYPGSNRHRGVTTPRLPTSSLSRSVGSTPSSIICELSGIARILEGLGEVALGNVNPDQRGPRALPQRLGPHRC